MIFFAFTLYNIPIVVAGFWRLWRSRGKRTKRIVSGRQKLPFVSIIVPVKNEEKVVARLLNALTSLNYPSGKKDQRLFSFNREISKTLSQYQSL